MSNGNKHKETDAPASEWSDLLADKCENELSWKMVLYPHGWIGFIDKMQKYAVDLGYPYFIWNDIMYETKTKKKNKFYCQLTVS